jgi:hypothetical protein
MRLRALLGLMALLGLGAGGLLACPRGCDEPARPAAEAPSLEVAGEEFPALDPSLAELGLGHLLEALSACVGRLPAARCEGRPALEFQLVAVAGQGEVRGLGLTDGRLEDDLWACFQEAARRLRFPTGTARGQLRVQYPLGCGADGRPQVLRIRREATAEPERRLPPQDLRP